MDHMHVDSSISIYTYKLSKHMQILMLQITHNLKYIHALVLIPFVRYYLYKEIHAIYIDKYTQSMTAKPNTSR